MIKKHVGSILVFLVLVLVAVLSRIASHAWNFTLIGAVALFAGSFFKSRAVSASVVLTSLLISDAIIGFHDQMLSVYGAYLLIVILGSFLNVHSSRWAQLRLAFAGSFLFFLITNFSVWYLGTMYPQSFSGLIQSYVMAIPFFKTQLLSDVIFSFVLFEIRKAITTFAPDNLSETSDTLKTERSNY